MFLPRWTFYRQFLTDASYDAHFFGGIGAEVLGTFYLILGTMIFAIPMGVTAAIFLAEFSREGKILSLLRVCISTLAGVPSIVFGLFGLAFFHRQGQSRYDRRLLSRQSQCLGRLASIQVFKTDGTYLSETLIAPETGSQGSTWDLDFSRDADQKYIYLADGQNQRVYIIDRASMEVLTKFGGGGRQPGLWFAPHSLATDSKGNIYTTETYEGKRIQKFIAKGITNIPAPDQGALWPAGELN